MKRLRHLLTYSLSGWMIAVGLSLAYLLLGSWDFLGWSPEPLWAQILLFPGVAAGQLCWIHLSHSEFVCRVVGVGTMGVVGGIIGLALHVAICRRKSRKTDNEPSSA